MDIKKVEQLMDNFTGHVENSDNENLSLQEGTCQNEFMNGEVDYWDIEMKDEFKKITGLDTDFKCVDRYGGCDMGSNFWSIYKINDEYIKFQGHYASHHGADYESMEVVKPVEEVVTVWK